MFLPYAKYLENRNYHMRVVDPKNTPTKDLHQYLLAAVSPRPIALASTIDENGQVNLAPYSFFNCFSSNPPILVFSSNRRVKNNTTKDTLHNIERTREVVIHSVNYPIVRQMTLSSIEYSSDINEFEKAGFTAIPSDLVKPPRVKESPVHMECKVRDIITLGESGGAGHLIICDMVRMHINEEIFDTEGKIDPHKLDMMGRMGRSYYVRASGDAVHRIYQPVMALGIGFDGLPKSVVESKILNGNELSQLAKLTALPTDADLEKLRGEENVRKMLQGNDPEKSLHKYAKEMLNKEEDLNRVLSILMLLDA